MQRGVEIWRQSAIEQSKLLRRREISVVELTQLYLERTAELQPRLAAFTHIMEAQALREARRRDAELRSKPEACRSPLWGVPIGIKDLNLVRGSFTRFGSRTMRYLWLPFDDRTVGRIRKAGLVPLGKTATSEFGAMPVTEPDIHAPTRNPWGLDRTPGGSSGGSGAALAAGLVPIAHGNDGAGSIRIPAAFCHLFGFKPSRGVVRDAFGRNESELLMSCGPLARTVDDAAALLDAMAGSRTHENGATAGDGRFLSGALRPAPRLRVRYTTRSPICTTEPDIAAAVERLVVAIQDLGAEVDEGSTPEGELSEFVPIWQATIAQAPVLQPSKLQPVTRWLWEAGRQLDRSAVRIRQQTLARRLTDWFADADVWVTPTVAKYAPTIGALTAYSPERAFAVAAELGAFTALFNITGQPAANIPAGFSRDGHAIGVQIAGRPGEDATVLALARQLEQALPWAHRWPVISLGSMPVASSAQDASTLP